MRYIIRGMISFVRVIPIATAVYVALSILLWICKKRKFKQFKTIEFVFLVYIITILDITGIIGMQINIDWFKNSFSSLGLYLPTSREELLMSILNMILFIPIGVFMPIVFQNKKCNMIVVLIVGLCFSIVIEFLQMFGGRMAELDDVLMNSLGTLMGYWFFLIYQYISKIIKKEAG